MAKALSPHKRKGRSLSSVKPISHEIVWFDYKEPRTLQRFILENGAIAGRDKTGLSAKQQRLLARETKRARHLGMLPFTQTL